MTNYARSFIALGPRGSRNSRCDNQTTAKTRVPLSLSFSPLSILSSATLRLPYLLSEDVVSERIIILFRISSLLFLRHASPYLSSLSFVSEFHLAVHVIKILFLPFLFAASGADGDSPKTNLEIVYIALLIPMYPAFVGGHCTFSGTHTVSGPAAAATSPLAV